MNSPQSKPLLRGYLHQEAFFIALGASVLLIARAANDSALIASIVYSSGLLLLFGFSAIYHRFNWEPRRRAFLKRIDHSAIFLLIAGTTTPIAMLALPQQVGEKLLWTIWGAAAAGIIQSIFWVKAPKWVTATLCIAVGWLSFPYVGEMAENLSRADLALLVSGGVAYSIGAIFYALKKPNFFPGVFGYHELFHLCTIVAAGMHFAVIYSLVNPA